MIMIWDTTIYKKQKMNPPTSIALREDVIQRTVYVSDIDQQVTEEQLDCLFIGFGQVYVSSTSSYLFVVCSLSWLWKVMCFLDSRVSTGPVFGPQAEDEHEMRARKIYYTKIDTKGESLKCTCLFPCYLCSPRHDILRGQPDAGFSLFPQSENMNLDDRGGKAWSCGGDVSIVVRRFSWGENVVWLFLGVANTSIILHDDEFLKYFKISSREL
ncbi:hypothetical protein HID58_067478 [Brassica napus]|uniref:RRM domain-containing protein n=1 Tax=Brassica napus TaxID=3708 RepID=A0ABQ7ZIL2_BRANA|nr:hypothetical protein HID58_067478 [Brassica napus]